MEEINIISLKCSCGRPILSENIFGSMAYCEACHSHKLIGDSSTLKPVFNKIVPFVRDARYYRQLLLDYFMKRGDAELFDRMKWVHDLQRYYVPVREIGSGSSRRMVALNQSNKDVYIGLFSQGPIDIGKLRESLPEEKFREMVVADYKPIYQQMSENEIEFLKIDVSMDKLDHQYQVDQHESLVVKYLPVFILETNLCKMVCIGFDEHFVVWNEREVLQAIQIDVRKTKFKLATLFSWIQVIGTFGVIAVAVYGIYRFCTMGLNFEIFIKLLLKGLFLAFLAVWCAIWIGLYIAGFLLIFSPLLLFVYSFIEICYLSRNNKYPKGPNLRKGIMIMKLT